MGISNQTSNIGNQTSNIRNQRSNIRNQTSNIRIRRQTSEIRRQTSEIIAVLPIANYRIFSLNSSRRHHCIAVLLEYSSNAQSNADNKERGFQQQKIPGSPTKMRL